MRFAIVCQQGCNKEQVWYGDDFTFILPHPSAEICPWCGYNTYLKITEDETPHNYEIRGATIYVQGDTNSQEG